MNGAVMRAVVVYESMYGNTRAIAEAIGAGLGSPDSVTVVPVNHATPQLLAGVDLLVVGGPTHAWSMSRPNTRQSAVASAAKPNLGLVLEPDAGGPGLREWFESLGAPSARAVAFDTRLKAPVSLTGRASRRIDQLLREHGYQLAAPPQSFFVNKRNQLLPGELERARAWGNRLAGAMSAS